MRSVNVSKEKLIWILQKNKKKHIKEYETAVPVYKNLIEDKIEDLYDLKGQKDPEYLKRLAQNIASLRTPVSHKEDYDRAIAMLDMSVDESIVLEESEFRNYVEDEWNWSREVAASNTMYATGIIR